MSLGNNTTDLKAKPDVVIFYLSSTSPQINTLRLSKVDAIDRNATALPNTVNYDTYEGIRTRSGKFAVNMNFDSGSSQKYIKRVQVRLPNEAVGGNQTYSNWRTVWETGTSQNTRGITFTHANPAG